MHLNKSTRFALYALTELARVYPEKQTVQEMAARCFASEHHLSKVMQMLTRFGFVEAVRGVGGGYLLSRSPKQVTVMDVVRCVEPQFLSEPCASLNGLEPGSCHSAQCAVQELFDEVARQVSFIFAAVTIDTLAARSQQSRS